MEAAGYLIIGFASGLITAGALLYHFSDLLQPPTPYSFQREGRTVAVVEIADERF